MLSSFAGIEMGKRALNAFRLGMQTVGHNVSNMETEGYSRQVTNYATVQPMDLQGIGQVGQGVQVTEIRRIRDEFLDFQYRSNQANLGYWDEINSLYDSIQTYISEPAGEGVRAAMDTFFNAMQSVQQAPEDTAARRSLVESAQSLGGILDSMVSSLEMYSKSVNQEILTSVQDANKMLHEIAALNKQIYHAEALDQNANDLLDQRDLLLDKLSSMMDITYQEPYQDGNQTGEFFLTLNGRALIQGDHVRELVAHAFNWDGQVYYDVQVSENEFDISNCAVAEVLTTGPEGVHQLSIDRLANGESWTVGGGDAYCLETRSVTSSEIADGKILTNDSDKTLPYKLSFRTLMSDEIEGDSTTGAPTSFVVKVDWDTTNGGWVLRAEDSKGDSLDSNTSTNVGSELTVERLSAYLNKVAPITTFSGGVILSQPTTAGEIAEMTEGRTLSLTTKDGDTALVKITWDDTTDPSNPVWTMSVTDADGNDWTDADGNVVTAENSENTNLTVKELSAYLDKLGLPMTVRTVTGLTLDGATTVSDSTKTFSFSVDSAETSGAGDSTVVLDTTDDTTEQTWLSFKVGANTYTITKTYDNTTDPKTWTLKATGADSSGAVIPELDDSGNPKTDTEGNTIPLTATATYNGTVTLSDIKSFLNGTFNTTFGLATTATTETTSMRLISDNDNPVELADPYNLTGNYFMITAMDGDGDNVMGSLHISSAGERPMEVKDYSGMLGTLNETQYELEDVSMRVRPMSADEALGISGSFRIQVGTQGTRVTSENFRETDTLSAGEIIGEPKNDDATTYTFRVGVSDQQFDITATWNSSSRKWVLSSDVLTDTATSAGTNLSAQELTDFISEAAAAVPNAKLNVVAGTKTDSSGQSYVNQFYLESKDAHLISISDVTGNLAEKMGIANPNPVITIDVAETDSLTIIRNKINEKYQEEYGLTEPEQWIHASLQQDTDQSWYLTMAANVAGEAQRITLMGGEDGNNQVLRRLGLTANVTLSDGSSREISAVAAKAEDASFTFDNVRYLSSDNMFSTARRIPASGAKTDYTASTLVEVSEGMRFNLKGEGVTTVTSRHHVQNGSIKALEEARDAIIPGLKESLDEMAYGLVTNLNAYQYSGYGIGSDITMTGVAFFDPLTSKAGASRALSVNDAIVYDNALIGAAMGKKGADGKAVSGVSGGSGDGTNAGRMNGLTSAKVLKDGTVSLGGSYDAVLAQIGSAGAHANLMYTAQSNVSDQIDQQRKAVSGVNLDEELMNIIVLNRAFGAMSRYVTTIDEMLNTIINGMGLVGR